MGSYRSIHPATFVKQPTMSGNGAAGTQNASPVAGGQRPAEAVVPAQAGIQKTGENNNSAKPAPRTKSPAWPPGAKSQRRITRRFHPV